MDGWHNERISRSTPQLIVWQRKSRKNWCHTIRQHHRLSAKGKKCFLWLHDSSYRVLGILYGCLQIVIDGLKTLLEVAVMKVNGNPKLSNIIIECRYYFIIVSIWSSKRIITAISLFDSYVRPFDKHDNPPFQKNMKINE